MKNTLSIFKLLLTISLCLSLMACAGNNSSSDVVEETIISDVAEPIDEITISYPLTLRVGYSTNDEDPRGVALYQFKEEVETMTSNNIIIDIYSGGKLGSDSELLAKMITKDIDMTVSSAGNYAAYATRIGVSALPFLFDNFDSAWEFVDSDTMSNISKELDAYNMHVLAYFDNGFRCVTTSEDIGPINKVSDMKDLNIRTPDNQIVMETMSELSANPRSFPFAQLKDALIDKEFDAQENPIPVIYNNQLYDVQKYLSITNHSYDAMPLTIRNDIWNALTPEYQQIIYSAAQNAQTTNRSLVREQSEEYVSLLEQNGMIVNYPDLKPFRDATTSVIDVFSNIYGDDLVNEIKNL